MVNLTPKRSPDEIKKALATHESDTADCIECPYEHADTQEEWERCIVNLHADALAYIELLECQKQHAEEHAELFMKENAELLGKHKQLKKQWDLMFGKVTAHWTVCNESEGAEMDTVDKMAQRRINKLEKRVDYLLDELAQMKRELDVTKRHRDALKRDMDIAAHDACCVCRYNLPSEEECSHSMEVHDGDCFEWRGLWEDEHGR